MLKKILGLVGATLLISGVCSVVLSWDDQVKAADISDVELSTTVQTALTFTINTGATHAVAFGNLTPGTPIIAPNNSGNGLVASVTTNAANGYTIGLSDGSDTNSALVQSATYIPDFINGDLTFTTPIVWPGGGTGVGVTMFAASTNKEAKWGAGTTYSDALNKYATIPAATTTAHTVTGYHSGADTSKWSFQIDVPADQQTGAYAGNVTFTATAVLS